MNTRAISRRHITPFVSILLAGMMVTACTSPVDAPPNGIDVTLDVQPDAMTLALGDSAVFTATALTIDGNVVEVDVKWSIAGDTGATVAGKGKGKKEGHFKPKKAGRWSVIGEGPDGQSDTSQVSVVESTAFSRATLGQIASLPDTTVLRYEVFGSPNRRVICIDLQVVSQGTSAIMNQLNCPDNVSVSSDIWLIDPVTGELVDPSQLAQEIAFLLAPAPAPAPLVQPYLAASAVIGDPVRLSLLYGGD
ncbi:MAG: hypothetical protein JSW51_01085 [Gemmatimonadota bacterium]|nr:MAG: hypothetical protein JSW51_01085 [Gemmatimonadota bacterium]